MSTTVHWDLAEASLGYTADTCGYDEKAAIQSTALALVQLCCVSIFYNSNRWLSKGPLIGNQGWMRNCIICNRSQLYKFHATAAGHLLFVSCILFLTFIYMLFRYLYIFREGDRQQTANKFETGLDKREQDPWMNKKSEPKWKKKSIKNPDILPSLSKWQRSIEPSNSLIKFFFKTSSPPL